MFHSPEQLLRSTKGTLKERPLPLLFHALVATRHTAGLELKRQAFEKVLVFEAGAPVGCTSNLVHESIGRYLVEKKALNEEQYLKVLALSAQRGVRFEKVVLDEKLLEAAALERHLQANLAQKILDAFRWTDARYRILGDVEIDPGAPRMNGPQMLYTALCSAVPQEIVQGQFPFPVSQRFALVHEPPLKLEELKLAPRDAKLTEALLQRPALADLAQEDLGEDGVRRRLFAFSLMGLVDLAEQVPLSQPRPVQPEPAPVLAPVPSPAPLQPPSSPPTPPDAYADELREQSRRRGRAVAMLVGGGAVIGAAIWGVTALRQPPPQVGADDPTVVYEVAPREKPEGAPAERLGLAPLPAAPAGACPQGGKPRALALSSSGIAFDPPEPLVGKAHRASVDGARKLAQGSAAEARTIFTALAGQQPKEPRVQYGLALASFLEGKDADARRYSLQALELAPEFGDAHLLAGFLDQLEGRRAEAVAHYQAFLKSEPASPRADDVRVLTERLER